ncbi:hypothetical protein C1N75_12715 [Curtobacterium sp. SGAir0571]|uniref:hypothetical protein n=1 Tax=Curtobacterium sp. SGAir0471 TaxID=2070337 RepID=UPI0010F44850|nr:hypothetical protein [Curtobacterium sp. SGAir0471]
MAVDLVVLQVYLCDTAKADDEATQEITVVDRLVEAQPLVDGTPFLASFAVTDADKDRWLEFADLIDRVRIGERWSTPSD